MKRKSIANNKTELADILNRLDGLRMGINRQAYRDALKVVLAADTACRVRGWRSPLAMLAKQSIKASNKFKTKKGNK